jgi:nucleoside phosphorylase
MTKIAVTFALPAESSEFLRRLRDRTGIDRNGIRISRGKIDDQMIEVIHTGVGEEVCRQRVARFLSATGRIRRGEQDQQFDLLISTGFAGALSDELKVGDLLLAKNFSTIDLKQAHSLLSSLLIHPIDLLTVSAMIDSSEERERIARESGAAAVDMETEFIARACADHGVPLLSLRVITDTPREAFPAPAHILFDVAKQRTDLGKLAGFFLMHPQRVPHLLAFARKITRARKILADALFQVLHNIER